MKHFFAFLILSVSVSAIAQETVLLNSKSISVNADQAILVRTSSTPDKVEVTFQVPMANTFCVESTVEYVHRICTRTEFLYRDVRVCRDVVRTTPAPTSTSPRGPRYNPGTGTTTTVTRTERVCTMERQNVGSRPVPYDCSYSRNLCLRYAQGTSFESDKVKIKFKNLPDLGGSEQETFRVAARQRTVDGSNVVYDITPLETSGREYEVKSKGLFGIDSYVIQGK